MSVIIKITSDVSLNKYFDDEWEFNFNKIIPIKELDDESLSDNEIIKLKRKYWNCEYDKMESTQVNSKTVTFYITDEDEYPKAIFERLSELQGLNLLRVYVAIDSWIFNMYYYMNGKLIFTEEGIEDDKYIRRHYKFIDMDEYEYNLLEDEIEYRRRNPLWFLE